MLASIQRITQLSAIPGADRIETAQILGWKCVVKKGQFQVDELVVFIEIDTRIFKWFLTDDPNDVEKIRLSTVKMKGQISQGLVLKLDKFSLDSPFEGLDISETLGVEKYEKPIPYGAQDIGGDFPRMIAKTDEVRIQSNPSLLDLLHGRPYYITRKMDGTSMTVIKKDNELIVCGRNYQIKDGDNKYWRAVRQYDLEHIMPNGWIIQGELCGEGIQSNSAGIKGLKLFAFNLYVMEKNAYAGFSNLSKIEALGFDVVPLVELGSDFDYTLDEIEQLSDGYYSNGRRQEGIVVRLDQDYYSWFERISFKCVSKQYSLDNKE